MSQQQGPYDPPPSNRPWSTIPPSSSGSSTTGVGSHGDVESQKARAGPVPHWKVVADPAGVDDAVLSQGYAGHGTPESPFVIDFLPGDAHDPLAFPQWKKWTITVLVALATLAVAFSSTAYSAGAFLIVREFHVSTTVAILGVSLFVVGFAVGPLLWAPLSEFYGRQVVLFFTYTALTVFNAAACGAHNIETLLILRFLAGAFGSSPLTNSGGVIADMFTAKERGVASGLFAMAPFLGPSIGPVAGGFLAEAEGWRWVEGLMAIFTGVVWIACTLLVPETYAPVLLRKRAEKLSAMTGRVYVSKLDLDRPKTTIVDQFKVALSRPWIMLFREPIVLLMSIYMAIIYGTLYMMFPAFPIVFQLARGWSLGVGGLPFLGLAVGMLFAVGYTLVDNRRYLRVAAARGGHAPPEARLPPAMVGSILIPIGLFWFAWSNGPEVHFIVPIIGTVFFAAGLVMVFLSLLNYLIDSYVVFAASVLAANSVMRSMFGAAFPLFTTYMYRDLGNHWASSVPAFLALACIPCPFLFYVYGGRIRMRCKFASEAAEVHRRMVAEQDDKNGGGAATEDQAGQEAGQTEHRLTRGRRRSSGAAAEAHTPLMPPLHFTPAPWSSGPYWIEGVPTQENPNPAPSGPYWIEGVVTPATGPSGQQHWLQGVPSSHVTPAPWPSGHYWTEGVPVESNNEILREKTDHAQK